RRRPMPSPSKCPSRETLALLLRGELETVRLDGVSEHLEKCKSCVETLRSLEVDDARIRKLQKALPAAGSAEFAEKFGTLLEAVSQRDISATDRTDTPVSRNALFDVKSVQSVIVDRNSERSSP